MRAKGDGEGMVPDMTRRTLLSRLRDLDDAAGWQQFFEVYWRLIYAFALRAGCSPEDAEDIVQETVAAVARRMPEFHYDRSKGSFRTWLRRIVEARVNDHLRKISRRSERRNRRRWKPSGRRSGNGSGWPGRWNA